jgi:hypothetical protein
MDDRGWQIWVIGGLGVWLVASPFIPLLQDEMASDTMVSFVTAGLLQIFLAIGVIAAPDAWKRWGLALIGLAVLALPWGLGFDKTVYAVWNAAIAGGLTFVLAVWSILDTGPQNAT